MPKGETAYCEQFPLLPQGFLRRLFDTNHNESACGTKINDNALAILTHLFPRTRFFCYHPPLSWNNRAMLAMDCSP